MDEKLVLIAYVLPGLAVVFGIPMALGLVPPNRFYGYRQVKVLVAKVLRWMTHSFVRR